MYLAGWNLRESELWLARLSLLLEDQDLAPLALEGVLLPTNGVASSGPLQNQLHSLVFLAVYELVHLQNGG